MAVSRRLRFEILRRDGNTCRYCGAQAPDVVLTVDHVIPTTLGGGDDPGNLVTACSSCNAGKSSIAPDAPIVADVDERAVRWAAAQRLVMQRWSADRTRAAAAVDSFDDAWTDWSVVATDNIRERVPRAADWRQSVESWLARGFSVADLVSFIPTAMHSTASIPNKWRYLCGIVWRTLDKLEAEIHEHIELEDQRSDEPAPAPPRVERCRDCDLGWIDVGDGSVAPCPSCRPERPSVSHDSFLGDLLGGA